MGNSISQPNEYKDPNCYLPSLLKSKRVISNMGAKQRENYASSHVRELGGRHPRVVLFWLPKFRHCRGFTLIIHYNTLWQKIIYKLHLSWRKSLNFMMFFQHFQTRETGGSLREHHTCIWITLWLFYCYVFSHDYRPLSLLHTCLTNSNEVLTFRHYSIRWDNRTKCSCQVGARLYLGWEQETEYTTSDEWKLRSVLTTRMKMQHWRIWWSKTKQQALSYSWEFRYQYQSTTASPPTSHFVRDPFGGSPHSGTFFTKRTVYWACCRLLWMKMTTSHFFSGLWWHLSLLQNWTISGIFLKVIESEEIFN